MLEIRDATASARDLRLLREMSFLAINWRDRHLDSADAAAVDVMLARPELRVYVVGWPRPGDRAVVAEQHGTPVGAAWYRLFTETAHGYGFVDTETPELGVAVRASARGGGVGSALLSALIDHARADGHAAISLSVERD